MEGWLTGTIQLSFHSGCSLLLSPQPWDSILIPVCALVTELTGLRASCAAKATRSTLPMAQSCTGSFGLGSPAPHHVLLTPSLLPSVCNPGLPASCVRFSSWQPSQEHFALLEWRPVYPFSNLLAGNSRCLVHKWDWTSLNPASSQVGGTKLRETACKGQILDFLHLTSLAH